jgi:hypothetical protein
VTVAPMTAAMLRGEHCLVCGYHRTEGAHFPRAVGMGRNRRKVEGAKVRICPRCHRLGKDNLHRGSEAIVNALLERAPQYWALVGEWNEDRRQELDRWVSYRQHKLALLDEGSQDG